MNVSSGSSGHIKNGLDHQVLCLHLCPAVRVSSSSSSIIRQTPVCRLQSDQRCIDKEWRDSLLKRKPQSLSLKATQWASVKPRGFCCILKISLFYSRAASVSIQLSVILQGGRGGKDARKICNYLIKNNSFYLEGEKKKKSAALLNPK